MHLNVESVLVEFKKICEHFVQLAAKSCHKEVLHQFRQNAILSTTNLFRPVFPKRWCQYTAASVLDPHSGPATSPYCPNRQFPTGPLPFPADDIDFGSPAVELLSPEGRILLNGTQINQLITECKKILNAPKPIAICFNEWLEVIYLSDYFFHRNF